jgi:hypothetical protein
MRVKEILMRRFLVGAMGLAGFVLGGCVESDDTYTLNPDGSSLFSVE